MDLSSFPVLWFSYTVVASIPNIQPKKLDFISLKKTFLGCLCVSIGLSFVCIQNVSPWFFLAPVSSLAYNYIITLLTMAALSRHMASSRVFQQYSNFLNFYDVAVREVKCIRICQFYTYFINYSIRTLEQWYYIRIITFKNSVRGKWDNQLKILSQMYAMLSQWHFSEFLLFMLSDQFNCLQKVLQFQSW